MADGDLASLDDVKAWLPDMANVTTSDDLLGRLITAASRFVCNYTGRALFDVTDYTELYDGAGGGYLLLRQWPAVEVDSVTFTAGAPVPAYTLEAPLPAGGCQRLVLADGCFPRGRSNVTVAYSAGYVAVPADVGQAVIELVGERFRARDRIGQTSRTLGGQETTAFSTAEMNATITALLAPYRRVVAC